MSADAILIDLWRDGMFPDARPQALLDKLVITAVSALVHDRDHKRWEPPRLRSHDRDAWKLPEAMRLRHSLDTPKN